MTSVRCLVPQPDQGSADKVFLHTGSITVSQHAGKASTPGGAQVDSFSQSQGPRIARMGSEFTAQLLVEGARCLEKSAILCQEGALRGWRMWESDPAYLRHCCWAKRPHFTCLESRIGPPVRDCEAAENHFNAACCLGQLCWVCGRLCFGLSWAACGTLKTTFWKFQILVDLDVFRWHITPSCKFRIIQINLDNSTHFRFI